jgi:dTDP-4-amino-4,6-dideoxygalactose transaminase
MNVDQLEKRITEKCRVIIVQHTFGHIVDTKKIRDIVDKINREREYENRIYIVEDCAHIFTLNYQDFDIGKYSDAVFFSFAQDKCISSTQGSLLVIKKLPVFTNSVNQYSLVKSQSRLSNLYNASYIVLWNLIKKEYFKTLIPFTNITLGRVLVILFRTFGLIKKQADDNSLKFDEIHKMGEVQAELLLEQLKKVDVFNEHRKKICKIYDDNLKNEFVFSARKDDEVLLRYPILVKNPNELKSKLKDIRIITGRWYASPIYPLGKKFYKDANLVSDRYVNTKFCCKYILNLPLNIEVDLGTAVRICNIINKYGESI